MCARQLSKFFSLKSRFTLEEELGAVNKANDGHLQHYGRRRWPVQWRGQHSDARLKGELKAAVMRGALGAGARSLAARANATAAGAPCNHTASGAPMYFHSSFYILPYTNTRVKH